MNADDPVLLLDLENLGTAQFRPRPLRARLEALLAAAGEVHHAVAAYARSDATEGDPLASLLAELRIAPLRVPPGPDAAELALLSHARRIHAEGGRIFLVGSADGRFAELAALGRIELLVWDGQPVAAKLADVAHRVRRLVRPTATSAEDTVDREQPDLEPAPQVTTTAPEPHCATTPLTRQLLAALTTGIGIAAGQRLFNALLARTTR